MHDVQPPIGSTIKKEVMVAKIIKGMTYDELVQFSEYFDAENEISINDAAATILDHNGIDL